MDSDRESELRRKLNNKKNNTKEVLKRIQFWFIAICAVLVLSFMLPIIMQKPKDANSIDSRQLSSILKWIVLSTAILTTAVVLIMRRKRSNSGFSEEEE